MDWLYRQLFKGANWLFRLYCFLVRPSRRGAYVAVWWNDHVLLVHNSYQKSLTLPSGGLVNNEHPLEGARRELEQEVGIVDDGNELRFLTTFTLDHDNMHDEIFVFELACDAKPTIKVDNREVTHARFERLNDALALELTAVASHVLNYYASRRSPMNI